MNGGKVSSRPPISIRIDVTFTGSRFTWRCAQRRPSTNQAASQTTMAHVVTPDNGPLGGQNVIAPRMAADASVAKAKSPTANEPIPAANIAAAPGPFGSGSGSGMSGRLHDCLPMLSILQ